MPTDDGALRIANCSGFFGDRLSAAQGDGRRRPDRRAHRDWLAELTMLILHRTRERRGVGYARTFLTQMEQVLGTCLDRGIRVVTNAGGLDPAGCAEQVREFADRLGLSVAVAHVEGRRPAGPTGGAPDGRAFARAPRHRAAARRARRETADRERVPRGVGHRRGAVAGRRRGRLPTGHRRLGGGRAGGLALRVGTHRLGPSRRSGRRGARHRVWGAVHRWQLRVLHRGAWPGAPRLPDRRGRRGTGRASSPSTTAPADWSPSAPSPPSCCTRSAPRPT